MRTKTYGLRDKRYSDKKFLLIFTEIGFYRTQSFESRAW